MDDAHPPSSLPLGIIYSSSIWSYGTILRQKLKSRSIARWRNRRAGGSISHPAVLKRSNKRPAVLWFGGGGTHSTILCIFFQKYVPLCSRMLLTPREGEGFRLHEAQNVKLSLTMALLFCRGRRPRGPVPADHAPGLDLYSPANQSALPFSFPW